MATLMKITMVEDAMPSLADMARENRADRLVIVNPFTENVDPWAGELLIAPDFREAVQPSWTHWFRLYRVLAYDCNPGTLYAVKVRNTNSDHPSHLVSIPAFRGGNLLLANCTLGVSDGRRVSRVSLWVALLYSLWQNPSWPPGVTATTWDMYWKFRYTDKDKPIISFSTLRFDRGGMGCAFWPLSAMMQGVDRDQLAEVLMDPAPFHISRSDQGSLYDFPQLAYTDDPTPHIVVSDDLRDGPLTHLPDRGIFLDRVAVLYSKPAGGHNSIVVPVTRDLD